MKRFSKPPLVTVICRNKEAHVWVKICLYPSPIAAPFERWELARMCVRKKNAPYMFFLIVFKWWELLVMPWHTSWKINIKHPPWQPAFLKAPVPERDKKEPLPFPVSILDALAKSSPSSDVTGDFCSSSLHRKPLAFDCSHTHTHTHVLASWLWVENATSIQAVVRREKSHWLHPKSLADCHSLFRILPFREMKEKHTRIRTRTHKRSFNHLSKSHTDTAVN